MGSNAGSGGVRFDDRGDDAPTTLPSAGSAILLLSGSDPAEVDVAMKYGWAGAWVAGQSSDGCYGPAASIERAARGGDTASPVELAQRLVERWSA